MRMPKRLVAMAKEIGLTDEERDDLWIRSVSLSNYVKNSAASICGAQLNMIGIRLLLERKKP